MKIFQKIFQKGILGTCYMPTNDMPADLQTKSLGKPSHNAHLETIGLTSSVERWWWKRQREFPLALHMGMR